MAAKCESLTGNITELLESLSPESSWDSDDGEHLFEAATTEKQAVATHRRGTGAGFEQPQRWLTDRWATKVGESRSTGRIPSGHFSTDEFPQLARHLFPPTKIRTVKAEI